MRFAGLVLAQIGLGFLSVQAEDVVAKRPVTVRDSIEWAYVLPFSWIELTSRPDDVALYAPDRAHFILHTRRGDLEKNVNVDTLLLYATKDVAAYIRQARGAHLPEPVMLLSLPTTQDEEAIAGIRWLDNEQIGFVSKEPNGAMQASTVDIHTRKVSQLTSHGTDVLSFSRIGANAVYYACAPVVAQQPPAVRVQLFFDALPRAGASSQSHCDVSQRFEMFSQTAEHGIERLPLPVTMLSPTHRKIWLSPSGDHAVILAPAVNAPAHWADYQVPDPERWGFGPRWVRGDPTSMDLINRYRYLLVNLRERTIRSLFDAPSGALTFNLTPPEVFWRSDGRSVIVSSTYLPLEGVDRKTREERTKRPAIAEVDIVSGAATPIVWEDVPRNVNERAAFTILELSWEEKSEVLTLIKRRTADGAVLSETHRRTAQGWKGTALRPWADTQHPVSVTLREALNERPRVYAESRGQRKILLDPNPQAEQLALATTQVVEWKDANGLDWAGGLLLPVGYSAGKRYPLIVQTHGFDRTKFLLDGVTDGAGGTAYAAQVFAGAGFVVLQVPDHRKAQTVDTREGPQYAEGFRAGIEKLVAQGLVDLTKVGLIAFSRTGFHTLHLLAQHPSLLAAASLSDSLQLGYVSYLYGTGISQAEAEYSKLLGGAPEGARLGEWFARNPLYALSRSRAAIRLEEMSSGLGSWETYALLTRAGRPVEFMVYPQGGHVLQKPAERLASQGGNVDWFRFWLQGYEDPAEDKREQYQRWRAMREKQAQPASPPQAAPLPADEFSWLEPELDDRALAWARRESHRTLAELEGDERFERYYRKALAAGTLGRDPQFALEFGGRTMLDHGWIYQKMTDAEHPRGLWRRTTLASLLEKKPRWRVLLDVDALARKDGKDWALGPCKMSPSGRRCIAMLSHGGSAKIEGREFDVESGAFVEGGFRGVWQGANVTWRDDDTLVLVTNFVSAPTRDPARVTVREWSRGTPFEQAKEIFRGELDDQWVYIMTGPDGLEPAAGGTVLVQRTDRDGVESRWMLGRDGRRQRMTLSQNALPALVGDRYVFQVRNSDWSMTKGWSIGGQTWKAGSIVSIPAAQIADPAPKVELVMEPKGETAIAGEFYRTSGGLLLVTESMGENRMWRARLRQGRWAVDRVPLPEKGLIFPIATHPNSGTALIRYENRLQPPTLYRVEVERNEVTTLHADQPSFDSSGLVVETLEAKSADGALVPYSIVRPKELRFDGTAPTLVESYGFGGASSMIPFYSGQIGALWLEQGGVYVQAGIRGGSERGPKWVVVGADRQRTYDDMIAVMQDLTRRRITSPRHLAIKGHSAGGLLVGAVMTQRPDLMNAVLVEAGVLDQIRWHSEDNRFRSFFGSLDNPAQRAFLERTSPYQNLKKSAPFPVPFIITATTDDNVPPKHSRRFAAKMDSLGLPYLYYEAPEGGHSMANTAEQAARLDAWTYVYLARRLIDQPTASR